MAASFLTRVTWTLLVTVLPCGSSAMAVIVCGPKARFFAPCHSSVTCLPEPTSAPVKLRISLPSAWKVIRATVLGSVATALMVSACTYCSLVAGG